MKFKTSTFLKQKKYLLSLTIALVGGIFFSLPVYGQADYYYGVNKTGLRLSIGGGADVLQSNWTTNIVGYSGIVALDYDFSPYLSLGLQGVFGTMEGKDPDNKFYFRQSDVTIGSGNLNFKIAVGKFSDFETTNLFQDVVKRIYIGAGIGVVQSTIVLHPHFVTNGDYTYSGFQTGKKATAEGGFKSNGGFVVVPVNIGTNIPLRGLFGSDKLELNPNFQYSFVQSPVFDGYQPNKNNPNTTIAKNGNQAYFIGSLSLRYKF